MSTQRINAIMEYVYGEMNRETRAAFERKLESDPALKNEVDALLSIRHELGAVQNEEPTQPGTLSESEDRITSRSGSGWTKTILAVAASLILILFAAYTTRFQLRYNGEGLYIGFHTPVQDNAQIDAGRESKDNEKMREIFRNEVVTLLTKMDQLEHQVRRITESPAPDTALPEQLISSIEASNESHIRELVQYINDRDVQQRDFMQDLLTQYANYAQQQREEDLLAIGESIGVLRQSQVQQKHATDQLVTRLVTSTNYE